MSIAKQPVLKELAIVLDTARALFNGSDFFAFRSLRRAQHNLRSKNVVIILWILLAQFLTSILSTLSLIAGHQ